jgi:hypothetical protein
VILAAVTPNASALQTFIAQAVVRRRAQPEPAGCVLAPPMLDLTEQVGSLRSADAAASGPQRWRFSHGMPA